jgi:peroxiredoxin
VVSAYIREHLESPASIYLLQRYLLLTSRPDYKEAQKLVDMMLKVAPENGQLIELQKQLKGLQGGALNSKLTAFTATDVKGRKVTEKDLKGKLNVVSVWATWSYSSTDQQRRLKTLKDKYGDKLGILSICVDGRPNDCKQRVERDSLKWSTVCDGRMWNTPLMAKFGLADVPANLVIDERGKIIERNLQPQKLEEFINQQMLKNKVNALVD